MKWIAPTLAYLAVSLGLFVFHSGWGALLGFHIAIIVSLLIAKPNIPVSILVKSNNFKWIVLSILLCGSSGITLYVLWDSFGFADNLSTQVESLGLNARTWIPFIAYFASANPFIEEYFWRGYLGSASKHPHISDFLYAGFHGLILIGKVQPVSILLALSALVAAGWFWRQVMRKDRGLLTPVVGHMAADFSILISVYQMTL